MMCATRAEGGNLGGRERRDRESADGNLRLGHASASKDLHRCSRPKTDGRGGHGAARDDAWGDLCTLLPNTLFFWKIARVDPFTNRIPHFLTFQQQEINVSKC